MALATLLSSEDKEQSLTIRLRVQPGFPTGPLRTDAQPLEPFEIDPLKRIGTERNN